MLACIGDIHYDKLSHRIPNFNSYISQTLRSTIKDAVDYGAATIAIAGDVYNTPYPNQNVTNEFLDVVTDFPQVEFILIPGNHDYADITLDSLRTARFVSKKFKANIRVIDKPTMVKIDGDRYQFFPHPYVEDMNPKASFAIGHYALNGAKGENGFKVRTKHQPKGNWILGDFHERQVIHIKKNIYEYIGSMSQLSWEESLKKSYLVVEDGGEKTVRPIQLSYKLIKLAIENDDELAAIKFIDNAFYYLKTKNGYILPKGWALEHPQVVRQAAIGAKKDKRAVVLLDSKSLPAFNHIGMLGQFLLSKKVKPDVVERCIDLAKNIKVGEAA